MEEIETMEKEDETMKSKHTLDYEYKHSKT